MSEVPVRTREKKIDNQVPEVSVKDTSAEDRLLEFVDQQISKIRQYTDFGGGQPTFFELNEALSNWSNMNCSLVALDVMAKQEYQKAKNDYEDFIAEKYTIIRNEHNVQSLAANKWLSTQEIMYLVQSDPRWVFEYRVLRDEVNAAEKKVAFCRRMLDAFESFKYNLGTLSKNVQAEVLNLSGPRELGIQQN